MVVRPAEDVVLARLCLCSGSFADHVDATDKAVSGHGGGVVSSFAYVDVECAYAIVVDGCHGDHGEVCAIVLDVDFDLSVHHAAGGFDSDEVERGSRRAIDAWPFVGCECQGGCDVADYGYDALATEVNEGCGHWWPFLQLDFLYGGFGELPNYV